jgi:transcriptional regulator with XRE-family HTH domain
MTLDRRKSVWLDAHHTIACGNPRQQAENEKRKGEDRMAEKNKLGTKIAQVRESRKLSPQDLADRTELPIELIKQLESGELVPSLSPLIKIARALGVRLGTFLDDGDNIGPVLSHAGDRAKVVRFSDKARPAHSDLDFYALASDKTGRHMEPFLIDIYPSSAKEIHLSAHEGEEFIYVLAGDVEISYGKEKFSLKEGDSIYYDSIVSHNVHCLGDKQAKILAVVYAPF